MNIIIHIIAQLKYVKSKTHINSDKEINNNDLKFLQKAMFQIVLKKFL